MNYYKQFKEGKGNRDSIFRDILAKFNNQPINVLEIGAMRDPNGRSGDGFSSFFFAEYIKTYGGKLIVCDIDPNAIACCATLIGDYYNLIEYYVCSGIDCLKANQQHFDLILLDGSDNPNEMLEEYELCRAKYIICDDFSTKGLLLRQKYPDFRLYKWNGYGHEVAIYGEHKETVYLDSIL